jgi:hypothetical protein
MSKGELFKWAAYDDVLDSNFLFHCVKILTQDPSIILCHCKTGRIDENSLKTGTYDFTNKINSPKPHERFGYLVRERHNSWVLIFGVIRASALNKTSLFEQCVGADRILLAELGLLGRLYKIPEYLFFRRAHTEAFTEKMYHFRVKSSYEKLKWWIQVGRTNFPTVKMCIEYIKFIQRAPLEFSERMACYKEIFQWLCREGWLLATYDVLINLLGDSRLGHEFRAYAKNISNLARIKLHERKG